MTENSTPDTAPDTVPVAKPATEDVLLAAMDTKRQARAEAGIKVVKAVLDLLAAHGCHKLNPRNSEIRVHFLHDENGQKLETPEAVHVIMHSGKDGVYDESQHKANIAFFYCLTADVLVTRVKDVDEVASVRMRENENGKFTALSVSLQIVNKKLTPEELEAQAADASCLFMLILSLIIPGHLSPAARPGNDVELVQDAGQDYFVIKTADELMGYLKVCECNA